jgi:hypothetical protein
MAREHVVHSAAVSESMSMISFKVLHETVNVDECPVNAVIFPMSGL